MIFEKVLGIKKYVNRIDNLWRPLDQILKIFVSVRVFRYLLISADNVPFYGHLKFKLNGIFI